MTSNPTIFGNAIAGSSDYERAIRRIPEAGAPSPLEAFYDLALADVAMAAERFRPVYEQTGGSDGFVSFELEPRIAHNTADSVRSALQLVERLDKPNVMIKVPGTEEGVPAVEELTAAGVNVNITLLFSTEAYERVALAYIAGLERRLEAGEPLDRVASVASFFVSRVDAAVDAQLPEGSPLRGKAAIANAKSAHRRFRGIFSGERWQRLEGAGARAQRPLWASTSTKDPSYRDVLYVEELMGPNTVTTLPEHTLEAFRDHGRVRPTAVAEGVEEANETLALLVQQGIDLSEVTAGLLDEGIRGFQADLDKVLLSLETRMEKARRQATGSHYARSVGPEGEDRLTRDREARKKGEEVTSGRWGCAGAQ